MSAPLETPDEILEHLWRDACEKAHQEYTHRVVGATVEEVRTIWKDVLDGQSEELKRQVAQVG